MTITGDEKLFLYARMGHGRLFSKKEGLNMRGMHVIVKGALFKYCLDYFHNCTKIA